MNFIHVRNKKLTFLFVDIVPFDISDPIYVRLPNVNRTDNNVVIDWSLSFTLNGPLYEYTLLENDFLIFRGSSTNSGLLPGRTENGRFSSCSFIFLIFSFGRLYML